MYDFVTLRLRRDDVGQILDGLEQRMIIWQATAEYLEADYTTLSDIVEECSHPEEAHAIAEHYENIIKQIRRQLE